METAIFDYLILVTKSENVGHMSPTEIQISLRIRAVIRILTRHIVEEPMMQSVFFRTMKTLIRLCTCQKLRFLTLRLISSLRKHAYSNILKIFPTKNWKFSNKIIDIFHISAQDIDCGYSLEPPRRGGSNEYPQSMFLSRNQKNNVYPCKPQFYYIKNGV